MQDRNEIGHAEEARCHERKQDINGCEHDQEAEAAHETEDRAHAAACLSGAPETAANNSLCEAVPGNSAKIEPRAMTM